MKRKCCDLPEEVVVEILSWLPPESLIRFKCVSKSWYALINSLIKNPEFVNKNLRNNENSKIFSSTTCSVFCCPGVVFWQHPTREFARHDLFKSVTIFHGEEDNDNINYVTKVLRLPALPREVHLVHALRRHCNGIICIAYGQTIILCNPAINEWRVLPEPCQGFGGFIKLGVGFGYDSRANDYKVVRFGDTTFLRDGVEYVKTRTEIYSLRSDSWREIGSHLVFNGSPQIDKEVLCKGVFYWFSWTHKIIISFNMFEEKMYKIRLPKNLVMPRLNHSIKLAVWNDSVALFSCPGKNGFTDFIEVWVTDDCYGGVKGCRSWFRKLIIRSLVRIVNPLTFLKNGELLMEAGGGRLALYNLRSQKQRNFTIIQTPDRHLEWDFSYVKSLVSVQAGS